MNLWTGGRRWVRPRGAFTWWAASGSGPAAGGAAPSAWRWSRWLAWVMLGPTREGARRRQYAGERRAGRVTVAAREVHLTDSVVIKAETSGRGDGGEIAIQTGTLRLTGKAQISDSTNGEGQAGPSW